MDGIKQGLLITIALTILYVSGNIYKHVISFAGWLEIPLALIGGPVLGLSMIFLLLWLFE